MLKNMKAKALALLTALAMVLGLGVAATAPAYAVDVTDGGALTVTSTNKETFAGKNVSIYQMFSAKVTNGDIANPTYAVNPEWNDFFTTKIWTGSESTNIQALDENGLVEFAGEAYAWLYGLNGGESHIKDVTEKYSAKANADGKAGFTDLKLGYYLVVPEDGSTSVSRGTKAILVNVLNADTVVEIKSEYPTVDKTAEEGDHDEVTSVDNHASVHVGDTITFSLKSTVPDMSDFNAYTFYFTDKLSDGLTFGKIKSVKIGDYTVLLDETDPLAGSAAGTYKFTHPSNNLQSIRIDINNAYKLFSQLDMAGKPIEVTYTAVVNENAVVDAEGDAIYGEDNQNEAKVHYSTDPDANHEGESVPDKVHTYTFGFDVEKVGESETPLAGAKFELRDDRGVAVVFTEQEIDGVNYYRPAKDNGEFQDPDASTYTQVTSDSNGMIHFIGLQEGDYQLVETMAPAGYNLLTEPIKVTIAAAYRENGELESWSVQFNNDADNKWTYGTTADVPAKITVENKKGGMLPGTGGMGTVLFTVAGVALIAFGVFWSLKRSKSTDRRH